MAGNADEWTRSLWGASLFEPYFKDPYTLDDDREGLAALRLFSVDPLGSDTLVSGGDQKGAPLWSFFAPLRRI